eukprot:1898761-Rhodomonas_salina.2
MDLTPPEIDAAREGPRDPMLRTDMLASCCCCPDTDPDRECDWPPIECANEAVRKEARSGAFLPVELVRTMPPPTSDPTSETRRLSRPAMAASRHASSSISDIYPT